MSYRRQTYTEQIIYLLKFKIEEVLTVAKKKCGTGKGKRGC